MIYENFISIIQATIIVVETIVLIFLLYHIRELHKRTKSAHEEIQTMNKVISEIQCFMPEVHNGSDLAQRQIEMMKEVLLELRNFQACQTGICPYNNKDNLSNVDLDEEK